MGFFCIRSFSIFGIECVPVTVEVQSSNGYPSLSIVGLPDKSICESTDRVRSAIISSGFRFPLKRITVNLTPANIPKRGPMFDLPIAVGILAASGEVEIKTRFDVALVGELSLSGRLLPIGGATAVAAGCADKEIKYLVLPCENAKEASLIKNALIIAADSLTQCLNILSNDELDAKKYVNKEAGLKTQVHFEADLHEVMGNELAKRSLEVSIAGGHNLLLIGSPGVGKTMLASRIPSVLPPLNEHEVLEVTKIYSAAGMLEGGHPVTRMPFRAPSHTISEAGMIGGGSPLRPGEVTLSHNGVLFMDEIPLFRSNVLEALREPIEEGRVRIARASGTYIFPSRFFMIASMNPCPCGFRGDDDKECLCTEDKVRRYLSKISGPILDRIDICSRVMRVKKLDEFKCSKESSSEMFGRILSAREIQRKRLASANITLNSQMNSAIFGLLCEVTPAAMKILSSAYEKFRLSMRSISRILCVAMTIADLEAADKIDSKHICEAISYRMGFGWW